MRLASRLGRPTGQGGYALIFALAVMVVVLIIGLRFLAVVHSRQKTTGNEKNALQAVLLADAGLERAARELSQDVTWNGSFTGEPLAGGTYSAQLTGWGTDYAIVESQGTFRDVTRRRVGFVYTPDLSGSAHVWASRYGAGPDEWQQKENLIDGADGETGSYAWHTLGEANNQMSLAGFDSDLRSVPVTKVEIVISGYVDRYVLWWDRLQVSWRLQESGESGQWHTWPRSDLLEHRGSGSTGRMYLDVTDDPPPGGWHWQHFAPGTDLELRFTSSGLRFTRVKLFLDCVGFQVTWGTGP